MFSSCQSEDLFNFMFWKIWDNLCFFSCQATNLAGTGQQATPVTVRHTGGKKNWLQARTSWTHSSTLCQTMLPFHAIFAIVWLFQWRHITRRPAARLTTTVSTVAPVLTTSPSGSSSAGIFSKLTWYRRRRLIGQSAGASRLPQHKQILWPLISTWMPIALPAWMS